MSLRRGSHALRLVMAGGLAAHKGFAAENAIPFELRMGEKHELEHTADRALARQIALDHLAEDPHYYSRLRSCRQETAGERQGRPMAGIGSGAKRLNNCPDSALKARIDRVIGKKS